MFTKKPEAGDSVTKMGERLGGETKTERPKMIPSIIGEGLTITGNVASKGEIQVDGEIQGMTVIMIALPATSRKS